MFLLITILCFETTAEWCLLYFIEHNNSNMGSGQCNALEGDPTRKTAAYGLHECLIDNDREYAVVNKSMECSPDR